MSIGPIPYVPPFRSCLDWLCLSKTSKGLSGRELYFFLSPLLQMLISLTTLFATLSSAFRSRSALQLENLALRHQLGVLQRSARNHLPRGPHPLGLVVSGVERLALSAGHRATRDGHCLASRWLPPFLDLEGPARPTGTTRRLSRGSRSDPQDVP
jgi:hypothetical protein